MRTPQKDRASCRHQWSTKQVDKLWIVMRCRFCHMETRIKRGKLKHIPDELIMAFGID